MIQVVVTYRDHFFNRFVRWWGIKWTHAAIRYKVRGKWRVFETAALGTVERDWESFIKTVDEYETFETIKKLTKTQETKLISFAWGNVGKTYNIFRLMQIDFKYLIGGRKPLAFNVTSHICSSFTDSCYNHININLVPTDDIWVTPDELSKSELLKRC
jgi:hypothetical protein